MGCSNCGLSFCNKCLKQKCKIPNKGPSEHNVCKLCYSKLASGTSTTQPANIPPPDVFIKRLENLENPLAPPITMYKQDSKIQALRSGLSPADQKILDRLEKLKEEKGPPPTEGELRRRLASLKGENDYVEGPSKPLFTIDTRTDQQKADSLLEQFVSERDIELAHNPQDEIEARLATLREQGVRPNEGPYISNLHDSSSSEEEMDKITKKIMDEVAIEERCPKQTFKKLTPSSSNEEENERSSPELPWCVLCNNDAKFRCFDCGGDLYCGECNVEVHKNWGDTDHKVVPYKPK
jgi:hypothetical protein